MDSTAPIPERLFFDAARAVFVFIRDLHALDWILLAVIAMLIAPVPCYRTGAIRGGQVLLIALAIFAELINLYVLVASSNTNIPSPEKSTLALVDISDFLSPIIADAAILCNTIQDELAQGMTLQQALTSSSSPIILKIGRLLDSVPFVQDRMSILMDRMRNGGEGEGTGALGVGRLEFGPKLSEEIGTGLQIFDDAYTFYLFAKAVFDERECAKRAGSSHIPRTALACQATRTLIALAFANFIAPIIISAGQLVALLKSHDDDGRLQLYLAIVKSLIQILGASAASVIATLQRRRNESAMAHGSIRLEEGEGQVLFITGEPEQEAEVQESPRTNIDVRHLSRAGGQGQGRVQGHTRRSSRSGTLRSQTLDPEQTRHRWTSYSRAFQQYPEDSQHWDFFVLP